MLTIYLDASENKPSYTRPNPPLIHSVGCYLARKTDWDKFRKEWRIELGRKNVPHFHMKDFEYAQAAIKRGARDQVSSKSPYKNWSVEEFWPFQKRLYRVMNRKRTDDSYRVVSFTSSLIKSDFDRTLPDELREDSECKSYYIFNVANLMKTIALWCSSNAIYDPIHYIFAGGDREGYNLEKWFDCCWKDEQSRDYFRLSKGYTKMGYDIQWMHGEPALQAADIGTYELSKVALEIAVRGHADILISELRKSLPVLCQAEHFGLLLREEELLSAFAQIIRLRKSKGML